MSLLIENFKAEYGSKYAVEKQITETHMSVVAKGIRLDTKEPVCIKILKPQFGSEQESIQRFYQEGKILSEFNHPNIVKVFELSGNDMLHFLVMEYIDGKELSKTTFSKSKNQIRKQINIIKQINSALKHIHRNGKVHRDLKPSNIMLDKSGKVVLIDFGIAKDLNSTTRLTRIGSIFGTPYYMSPEQASGSLNIDHRSDIFSAGIILYEMLTGNLPFYADNELKTMDLIKTFSPVLPKQQNPNIPEYIEKIILKCLEKNPDHRYQNIDNINRDLESNSFEDIKHSVKDDELNETKTTISPQTNNTMQVFIFIFIALITMLLLKTVSQAQIKIVILLIGIITAVIIKILLFSQKTGANIQYDPKSMKGVFYNDFFVPEITKNNPPLLGYFEIGYGKDIKKTIRFPAIRESGFQKSSLGRGSLEYPLSLSHIKILDREELRMISRYQMEIFYNNQEMLIRNKSSSMPILVGDKKIEKDEIAQLHSGDKIVIAHIKFIYHKEDN